MKSLMTLMTVINLIIIIILHTIYLGFVVVFAEEVNHIINKPKWCNFFSLVDYYTYLQIFEEFLQQQKEYKYPCAQLI